MNKALAIIGEEGGGCSAAVALNIAPAKGTIAPGTFQGRAAVITLGCAKNQVDSEVMLGVLRGQGFEIVNDIGQADVAIVNTCSFLESAVQEGIDCILEVSDYKKNGRLRQLIVAGCMVSRYGEDLRESLPEVDSFVNLDDILRVGDAAAGGTGSLLSGAARPYFLYDDTMPRHLATQRHTAYVKIAEGCDRPCTFCIIPKIRGAMRSRELSSVVREVQELGRQGVREINLLAQDLTSYGRGVKGGTLTDLLHALDATSAVNWIRLLYAYPIGIDEGLLDAVAGLPTVCEYLDLPLQHVSNDILRAMRRPVGRYAARSITEFIKSRQPSIAMRTTFIVGFPGETEADVRELEAFVAEGHFASVGVFTYSQEAGTPAAEMDGQVPAEERNERRERVMLAQRSAVERNLKSYLGQTLEVLIEGTHEESDLLLSGRTRFQAPEVDGTVIINDSELENLENAGGSLAQVKITEIAGYDLVGRVERIVQCNSISIT